MERKETFQNIVFIGTLKVYIYIAIASRGTLALAVVELPYS